MCLNCINPDPAAQEKFLSPPLSYLEELELGAVPIIKDNIKFGDFLSLISLMSIRTAKRTPWGEVSFFLPDIN